MENKIINQPVDQQAASTINWPTQPTNQLVNATTTGTWLTWTGISSSLIMASTLSLTVSGLTLPFSMPAWLVKKTTW